MTLAIVQGRTSYALKTPTKPKRLHQAGLIAEQTAAGGFLERTEVDAFVVAILFAAEIEAVTATEWKHRKPILTQGASEATALAAARPRIPGGSVSPSRPRMPSWKTHRPRVFVVR